MRLVIRKINESVLSSTDVVYEETSKEKCEKHLKGTELEQDHLHIKNEPENSKSSQFIADSRKTDLLFGETKIDMWDIEQHILVCTLGQGEKDG